MQRETMILMGAVITFFSVGGSFLAIRRVKKQILEMLDALEDVKTGTGTGVFYRHLMS